MNLLFDQCGWKGDVWAQATADIWRTLPVLTTVGGYVENGVLTENLSEAGQEKLHTYQCLEYFWGTHFQY